MYKVQLDINLAKTLKYIPKKDQDNIKRFIDNLEDLKDPFIYAKKIIGHNNLYRYRVGNYRVLCNIDNHELIILIIDIAHRKEVYRKI